MPEELKFRFKCSICGREFEHENRERAEKLARDCEEGHDVVYVPLLRSDLQRLLAFIVSGNKEYITESLWRTLRNYRTLK